MLSQPIDCYPKNKKKEPVFFCQDDTFFSSLIFICAAIDVMTSKLLTVNIYWTKYHIKMVWLILYSYFFWITTHNNTNMHQLPKGGTEHFCDLGSITVQAWRHTIIPRLPRKHIQSFDFVWTPSLEPMLWHFCYSASEQEYLGVFCIYLLNLRGHNGRKYKIVWREREKKNFQQFSVCSCL